MTPNLSSRRSVLQAIALGAAGFVLPSTFSQEIPKPPRCSMGLVQYCCQIRQNHLKRERPEFDLLEAKNFLKHCQEIGAGGAQVQLGALPKEAAWEIQALT